MKDLETLIYSRLTNDAPLVALLGNVNRIYKGFQNIAPQKPQLTYWAVSGINGNLKTDATTSLEYYYQFAIFANNYLDILIRIRGLFDQQWFLPLPSFEEAAGVFSNWDQDLPDTWDNDLEVKRKDCRIRFIVKTQPLIFPT